MARVSQTLENRPEFFFLFFGVLAVAEGDDKVFPTRENRPEFFAKLPD